MDGVYKSQKQYYKKKSKDVEFRKKESERVNKYKREKRQMMTEGEKKIV